MIAHEWPARMRDADKELREHPRMAQALNMNANRLRSDYQAALALNPELKFGHFVAATGLGQNSAGDRRTSPVMQFSRAWRQAGA